MKGAISASFTLAIIAVHCCGTGSALEDDLGPIAQGGEGLEQSLGSLISEWYFSLKTSKGYCGLVPATAAAGGYGFALACNNKYPQYGSSLALLQAEGGGSRLPAATAAGASAGAWGSAEHDGGDGGTPSGPRLGNASAPVVVTSGQSVRVLARSAGLCNTPPVLPSPPPYRIPPSAAEVVKSNLLAWAGPASYLGSSVRHLALAVHAWLDTRRCAIGSVLGSRCAEEEEQISSCNRNGASGAADGGADACGGGGGGGSAWCRWSRDVCRRLHAVAARDGDGNGAAVGDVQPRAVICALGQPSALSYKIFKTDLKDGESVDLDKEWIYLMEGDKYCTLADVGGLSAVVSCHLDSPGWTGYKFQLQTMSYPRSQLHSLLTGAPCGVRRLGLAGPPDVECQPGEQVDRVAEVELVLQTPGSPLAAGVIIGFSTFSPGLMGAEQQRCCPLTASPHILLCENPPPGPVANECWFQMYDVKIASPPAGGGALVGRLDAYAPSSSELAPRGELPVTDPRVSTSAPPPDHSASVGASLGGVGAFLLSFLRSMQLEMSPSGLDPDLTAAGEQDPDSESAVDGLLDAGLLPQWRLLPTPKMELEMAATAGEEAVVGAQEGEREEGEELWAVFSQPRRRLLSAITHSPDPGSPPDLQPRMLPKRRGEDGGAAAGQATHPHPSVITRDSGALPRSEAAAAEPPPRPSLRMRTELWLWSWLWALGRFNSLVGAAAPLGDGSLVMLTSRAFGRYCSVSLDGTLLCISAQASNATRNLFTLLMPPMSPNQAPMRTEISPR